MNTVFGNYLGLVSSISSLLHTLLLLKMDRIFSIVSIFVIFLALALGYPFQERYRNMEATVDCYNYPTVMSYHVHVTYMLTNDDQIAAVSAFRDETQTHFAAMLGPDPVCQGTAEDPSGRYGTLRYLLYLLSFVFYNYF
jgi:hypothetical protein